MHVYIVFAHPSKASFNREVLEAFTRGLRDAGHSYEIGDLAGLREHVRGAIGDRTRAARTTG